MRCPKCGYISFDRQKSCSKCNADLTAADEQIQGTVGKAAAPFFLGAVLGEKTPSQNEEPAPDLHEEEPLALDDDSLDDDSLADQPLPSLGLEDIDVSDLVPPREEEEDLALSLGSEEEETAQPSAQEKDEQEAPLSGIEFAGFDSGDTLSVDAKETVLQPSAQEKDEQEAPLSGIEFSGFDSGDTLSVDAKETVLDDLAGTTLSAQASAEDDEIIDLSSLMDSEEETEKKEDQGDLLLDLTQENDDH